MPGFAQITALMQPTICPFCGPVPSHVFESQSTIFMKQQNTIFHNNVDFLDKSEIHPHNFSPQAQLVTNMYGSADKPRAQYAYCPPWTAVQCGVGHTGQLGHMWSHYKAEESRLRSLEPT